MNERDDMNLTREERRLQDAIRDLGEVRADEAFRARLRRDFVSGDIAGGQVEETGNGRTVRWPWVAAPALAAAVLALLMLWGGGRGWSVLSVRGSGTVLVDGQPVAAQNVDRLDRLVRSGARCVVPEGVELDLVLGDLMVLGVVRDSEVTIPAPPAGDESLLVATVARGELLVTTGPGFPGRTLHLVTTEGLTELVGTTVAINKGEGFTCVCVLEGRARIGKDADHFDEVPAGMRKVMFAGDKDPVIIPIEPAHEKDLIDFAARNRDAFK